MVQYVPRARGGVKVYPPPGLHTAFALSLSVCLGWCTPKWTKTLRFCPAATRTHIRPHKSDFNGPTSQSSVKHAQVAPTRVQTATTTAGRLSQPAKHSAGAAQLPLVMVDFAPIGAF